VDGIGRHHHPGPSTLPLVACASQRLANDCDDIPSTEKGGDVNQNPPEGGIKSPAIDHQNTAWIGVVRRNGVLELQEAFENTLFRLIKGGHLGTTGRAAEQGIKAMTRSSPRSCRAFSARGLGTSSKAERKMSMAAAGSKR